MFSDSPTPQVLPESRPPVASRIIAIVCAVGITALLVMGYLLVRNRFSIQKRQPVQELASTTTTPKGPPKVHILIDDPMLNGGQTLIGGTVKNISGDELAGLLVQLELRRRKDGSVEQKSVAIEPSTLAATQEGRYAMKLPVQEYGSVKLIGITGDGQGMLAYSSGQGLQRPLEKTGSKTITVQRPAPRGEEFLNTPDNPSRVP